jgi:multidomain signaling protein FimX
LCFQVTEQTAAQYITQIQLLAEALRKRGFRFAIEGFGSGRDPQGMLNSVALDFIKIDGAIIQGLTGDPQLQQRVRALVEAATKKQIQTIAERVEDANTMAILWQIGVQFIQGYFVNEPEQVVLKAERA